MITALVIVGLLAALEEARAEVERLLALVPQWISVEDKLPEDGQVVLVQVKDGWICTSSYLAGDGQPWCSNEIMYEDVVTHWMPLPAGPGDTPKGDASK